MRDKALTALARLHVNHPWRMLAIVVLITIIFLALASQLQVTMRWADLLPSNDRRTIQFNKIIEEFVSSTSIVVVVQGEESEMKAFADELAPRLLTAEYDGKTLIQRVDYKTEIEFLRKHGLMLIKEDDLKNIGDMFKDPNLGGLLFNINNAMEKEYVGQEESLSTREKEDQAYMFLDGLQHLVNTLTSTALGEDISRDDAKQAADKLLLGEPYLISYDRKALILNAIPNFTMFDTNLLVNGTDAVQDIVDKLLQEYPGVTAGLTGFIPIGHDEMVYSEKSLGYTTLIALIAILLLLIISLRMWIAPLFAILNLIIGIFWAVGMATVVAGQLNIMTQMMAVILLGLGIDFSIHLISNFAEWRAAGDDILTAMTHTFMKSGKGVLTGALTTCFAFLTLVISSSRGMKEMGLVTGFGLLAILVATFLFLPLMLVFRERYRDKKRTGEIVRKDITFGFLGRMGEFLSLRYAFTLLASLIITVLLIWSASKITFDQNYMNMEPEGLTSVTLQDTIINKFDMGMDYAMIITDDVEQSRAYADQYRELGSVALTEDISSYLPSSEEQRKRAPYIRDIFSSISRASVRLSVRNSDVAVILRELERLQMNVMEMQDIAFLGGQDKVDKKCSEIVGTPDNPDSKNTLGDLVGMLESDARKSAGRFSVFQSRFAPYFKETVIQMCHSEPIQITDLPETVLD
ncbi:MAG: MMPL family transporter, partial [candidate division KSB1 bacterium]|nr:MMPL family transporter [candidate division KSB1 bacterium]